MARYLDPEFLEKMRISSKIAVGTLEMIGEYVKPGITSNALNNLCHEFMTAHGCEPAPLGVGFPKAVCISLNHVICHGIPDNKELKEGDIVNIDVSLSKDTAYADTCKMFLVGETSETAKKIVQCAKEALYAGICVVAPGVSIRKIGQAVQRQAHKYGFSVVKDFCGHGIGKSLHELPQIVHYDDPHYEKFILEPGMTFTIEPMINVGKPEARMLRDGWTAVTKDGSLSAQYEHTLLVTETGVEIFTLRSEETLDEIFKFKS